MAFSIHHCTLLIDTFTIDNAMAKSWCSFSSNCQPFQVGIEPSYVFVLA